MSPRENLSEEDRAEEARDRQRLRDIDSRLRTVRLRRQTHLEAVQRCSAEQKVLADVQSTQEEGLEGLHTDHRAIGRKLVQLRNERDALRARSDELVGNVRMLRQTAPKRDPRPDALRREVAELEHRQQTTALPLAEENALISHLRVLRRQLATADQGIEQARQHELKRKAAEEVLRRHRDELDRLGDEMKRLRAQRDEIMQTMRTRLVEIGQLVASLREKGSQREKALADAEGLYAEIYGLEQEAQDIVRRSRMRRDEARRTLKEHTRPRAPPRSEDAVLAREAEANLEELLKRGRVRLGG